VSVTIQRALLLQSQGRLVDAERELRLALSTDPDNAYAHSMLALCLAEQKRFPEASEEATSATGMAPDLSFAHYVRAKVMYDRHRYDDSLEAIGQAIEREPFDPNYHGLQSAIHLEKGQWTLALESAEQGLESDPDHDVCTNLRAMSLVKLGRRDEADATIDGALERNPEDAFAHANHGWAMLNRARHQPALEHFREALRLDPQLEWARAGVVEAMKARNVVYRTLLGYFLWMSRLSNRAQWGVIIGLYVAYQALTMLGNVFPMVAPFTLPVITVYLGFVLMTWLGEPLFNSLLRLDKLGRHALFDDQRRQSDALLLLSAVAVVMLVAQFVFGVSRAGYGALACAMMMFPVVAIFRVSPGWPRVFMTGWAIVLLVMATLSCTLLLILPDVPIYEEDLPPIFKFGLGLIVAFIIGVAGIMIVANLLSSVRPTR